MYRTYRRTRARSQLVHLAVHCGEDATRQDDKKLVAFQDATSGPFSATFAYDGTARTYGVVDALSAAPVYPNVPLDLTPQTSESALQTRAAALKPIFSDAVGNPPTNMVYLKEAYFFVPILLALQLQQSAQYTAALDWFRSVYDFYLGIAVGAGTDVAIETADVVLVKSNPLDVVNIIKLSRATYRKMTQNLWWAAGYNILAIPIAAGALYKFGIVLARLSALY